MQESNSKNAKLKFDWGKRGLEALIGVAVLLVLAAISVPNLLRTSRYPKTPVAVPAAEKAESEMLGTPMVIVNGALTLLADDPIRAGNEAEAVTRKLGGYVGSMERAGAETRDARVSLVLRIPEARFDEARLELRKVGSKVTSEKVDARDVSAHYVDVDAQLRNFRAEEQQYLALMKRTGPVADTLEVARQLADVRGRIEKLEGEMRLLQHQVQYATLTLSISAEAPPVASEWTPGKNARQALATAGENLADYADFMVVLLVNLPLFVLWPLTAVLIGGYAWRLGAFVWRRWLAAFFIRQPAQA